MALENRKPLILLPQTYGPFRSQKARRIGEEIVRGSSQAWARDKRSFVVLQELLGRHFDERRHRCGVDVAFLLEAKAPVRQSTYLSGWLESRRNRPLVGINVSGLIYNSPELAVSRYGFRADYRKVVTDLVSRLIGEGGANIVILPHVFPAHQSYESDVEASTQLIDALSPALRPHIRIEQTLRDPREAKWLVAQVDWFCGTRMHATIASLSSGVPTAAVAYSDKTKGVFESCGQGNHVVDPRQLGTEEILEVLWRSWVERDESRQSIRACLPGVLEVAEAQMDSIVEACRAASDGRGAENS
jgi:polysaccharide pyruvyl transferase WcaK-like protein